MWPRWVWCMWDVAAFGWWEMLRELLMARGLMCIPIGGSQIRWIDGGRCYPDGVFLLSSSLTRVDGYVSVYGWKHNNLPG